MVSFAGSVLWLLLTVMQMQVLLQFVAENLLKWLRQLYYLWLNQVLQGTSIDRCGLGMRPRQDYTRRVMANKCAHGHQSPMCQCLALTSLRDSHPLPTRHIHEKVRCQALIDGFFFLPYFCFHTTVSVLWFQYFHFHTTVSVLWFQYFRFRTSVSVLQRFPLALSFQKACKSAICGFLVLQVCPWRVPLLHVHGRNARNVTIYSHVTNEKALQ